jgi:hypothetical protein
VHRLADGQVKHSPEVFYAGSLWKVSFLVLNLPCFCFCLHSRKSICDANLVIRSVEALCISMQKGGMIFPLSKKVMDRKHLQVSVQAFNDEDPHGRRTLGIIYKF